MAYKPGPLPQSAQHIPAFLSRELERIASEINKARALNASILHTAPDKPVTGIYYADGSDWDPGKGRGFYRYDDVSETYEFLAGEIFDSVILSDLSGEGILLGDQSSSAFGWRDITGEVVTRGVGATDPAWTQIGSGPFYAYAFAVNDVAWMTFHIPHDIVPGADIHLHVHWLPSGTDVNTVKWEFSYTFAKGFDQEAFDSAGSTISCEEAGPGVAYQHMVTETAAITISELTEPDGILHVRVKRVTNGGTDNADTIFMLTSDVHYQSTNIATIGKAPSFYGT